MSTDYDELYAQVQRAYEIPREELRSTIRNLLFKIKCNGHALSDVANDPIKCSIFFHEYHSPILKLEITITTDGHVTIKALVDGYEYAKVNHTLTKGTECDLLPIVSDLIASCSNNMHERADKVFNMRWKL